MGPLKDFFFANIRNWPFSLKIISSEDYHRIQENILYRRNKI